MLSDELLDIGTAFPHRSVQIRRLSALLLSPTLPSPPILVIYGQSSTGKSSITKTLLQLAPRSIRHVWAPCSEYITSRQLCERVSDLCRDVLDVEDADVGLGRCENVGALAVRLEYWIRKWMAQPLEEDESQTNGYNGGQMKKKFILVLDSLDAPIEANPLFLPALGRIPESIPGLTLVMIMRNPKPNMLHAPAPPHVHFHSYLKDEVVKILSLPDQIPKLPRAFGEEPYCLNHDQWASFWAQFLSTVYDSLARPLRDLLQFRAVSRQIFTLFQHSVRTRGGNPRNFSECYIRCKEVFRTDALITPSLLPSSITPMPLQSDSTKPTNPHPTSKPLSQTLSQASKFLLIAAHLASYTPSRHDYNLFTAFSDPSARKRRITALTARSTPNTPSKVSKPRQTNTHTTSATTAAQRKGLIPRHLLGPQSFGLERWLAIYRFLTSVHAPTISGGTGGRVRGGDLSSEVATLGQLRLVVRVGGGSDVLEGGGGKWRVNVGEEVVRGVARGVGVDLGGLSVE